MTVAVKLSTEPTSLLIRTQYEVVAVSVGVVKLAESLPTGVDVSPELP